MQTAFSSPQPARSLLARAVALAIASAAISSALAQTTPAVEEAAPRAKDDAVRLGTITITGSGSKLGAGQLLNEDAVKARSTVTKEATEKDRATGNSYQALSLLPGINTFNHDATGLFGGGLNVRGFDVTQLGFTINGVPVNDSGSYSVFPQEYVDMENICTQQISQGNPDVESPHVGATGGSVNIVSCDPEEKRRLRVAQTLGQLSLSRTFVRFDSGRFANNMVKTFISASHTQADKWKGAGGAKRDHFDAAFSLDLSPDNRILGSVMYNKAINNNIQTFNLTQLNTLGYYADYSTAFTPGHLPAVGGVRQVETGPLRPQEFYKLALNPFENAIVSVSGSFKLAENTYLKVQPYLWYGYGTGGVQQRALLEKSTATAVGADRDLNGDGDLLDTVIVANSSVTKTNRPGITTEISHLWGNHQMKLGFWYERAQHRQTGPAVGVDASGNPADQWLRDGRILRPDGSEFNSRNWLTTSPAYQTYFSDNVSFMNDRGLLTFGARALSITRKFTNFANQGGTAVNFSSTYTVEKSFNDILPQIGARFNIDREQQVFANVGKNFRAPPNFAYAPTNGNVTINTTTGVATLTGDIKAETSINTDVGYRYQGKAFTASATAFNVDFKNRQATSFDPTTLKSIYTNAGGARTRGIELEAGSVPVNGWSVYGSLTLQKSKVLSDIRGGNSTAASTLLPTNGKQFALTPQMLAGLSLQYSEGPIYARIKAKKTGRQYATLLNDEEVPSYMTADFDAGYKFADFMFIKSPQLRLNVSNLGNTKYRNPSSGFILNAKQVGALAPGNLFYYLGAPRFASVTLSADF
jgi:iron complex outermembrane recepter protein